MKMDPSNQIITKSKIGDREFFKLSSFKPVIKKTHPHKHDNYYELIVLLKGSGYHWIDKERYRIEPPVIFLLHPGQIHYWEITSIPEGHVIMMREDFFYQSGDIQGLVLFQQLISQRKMFRVENGNKINEMLLNIQQELNEKNAFSDEMVQAGFHMLLVQMIRCSEPLLSQPKRKVHILYGKFLQLLNSKIPSFHRVYEFARHLHITPQYLNSICQTQCGKSAGVLINEHLLTEAERYLIHTNLSINEICYQLNFRDPSHFGKFFKKLTGNTPDGFRRHYFQLYQI